MKVSIQTHSQSLLYFSKNIRVFCQDYQSLLYIFKTIRVFCFVETINVFCPLYLQRLSETFVFKTIKVLFTFPRLSKSVVLQRLSMSSALYVSKTSMSFVKTITVFSTFQRLQCLLSRLSKSSLLFQSYQKLFVETSMSPLFFKAYQSLSSRLQCLLYIVRLQGLLFDVPDASYIFFSFYRFHCLGFRQQPVGWKDRQDEISVLIFTYLFHFQ